MKLEDIAKWASVLTGESRNLEEDYYYVTEPVKRLMWKVTHLNRQLIAFMGLQGTGKTSGLKYVLAELRKRKSEKEMNPVILVKWTKNLVVDIKSYWLLTIERCIKW